MKAVIVPPIKSQGIKTKLVPWINDLVLRSGTSLHARWIEPFFGTGVVGFNSPIRGAHIVGDTNPHIINFYQGVQNGDITPYSMRAYLERESQLLAIADEGGYAHFREVRDRFNRDHSPYDFIFLSRAGFNGMMRFNRHGDWNIPFCKKSDRFAPAYITKICNQIDHVARIIKRKQWVFSNVSFIDTIEQAQEGDIIYCDPPYEGTNCGKYGGFDSGRFHEWARRQDNIFISEYSMPDDFVIVAECEKVILSAANGNSSKATERLYTNEKTYSHMTDRQKRIIALNTAQQLTIMDFLGKEDTT